jgi:hypothetical protein
VAARYDTAIAAPGTEVGHRGSRFVGVIVRYEGDGVLVRGRSGDERLFRLVPGAFALDGKAVSIAAPAAVPRRGPAVTASGSVVPVTARARVAQGSRLWVEGVHDAELVERVWGDDLRVEGVVVERLDGIDDLAAEVAAFSPGPNRRLGVLVDHLVAGSKESRIAAGMSHPDVLVRGTPYIDIWQAVKPGVVGFSAWPVIPKGRPWKEGVCAALGLGDPGQFWRRILSSVRTYADLEPSLVGAVESLIDFVTETEVD